MDMAEPHLHSHRQPTDTLPNQGETGLPGVVDPEKFIGWDEPGSDPIADIKQMLEKQKSQTCND